VRRFKPRFKLWLNTRDIEGAFGDGKWRLLRAIHTEGSLRRACESLQISYRKAWGDLEKAQEALGAELVKKERGGSKGGCSVLTAQGHKWLGAYGMFRSEVEKAVETAFRRHFKGLVR